jgi:hypothetical protein
MAIILLSQQENNMVCLNKKQAKIFLQRMERLPYHEIADDNGKTHYELMECKDIIIDKLNQDTVVDTLHRI